MTTDACHLLGQALIEAGHRAASLQRNRAAMWRELQEHSTWKWYTAGVLDVRSARSVT